MLVGSALAHCLLAGFLTRVYCIPTPLIVSTLLIQDRSRMRELRSYESVRGVSGNWHPYCDNRLLQPSCAERNRLTHRARLAILPAFSDRAGYGAHGFDVIFGVQENLCSAHTG